MSDRFVPLNPSGDGKHDRGAFVGLTGQHSHEPAKEPEAQAPEPEAPQSPPNIVLHRNGETIVAIEVECPCGQHVVLTCDYGDGSAN